MSEDDAMVAFTRLRYHGGRVAGTRRRQARRAASLEPTQDRPPSICLAAQPTESTFSDHDHTCRRTDETNNRKCSPWSVWRRRRAHRGAPLGGRRSDLAARPPGRAAIGLYCPDGMHPTLEGARVAAAALAPCWPRASGRCGSRAAPPVASPARRARSRSQARLRVRMAPPTAVTWIDRDQCAARRGWSCAAIRIRMRHGIQRL